ncbi:hypothetical protein BH20CHL7_BH20CHL7_00660 [soil metagenome]
MRVMRSGIAITLAAVALVGATGTVLAAGPTVERGSTHETFFDEFILDLCGIETMTTVIEHWTLKTFPDGSQQFHTSRTFIPEDPRVPIEKGTGMGFFTPDGVKTVVGKPLQLFSQQHGGVIVLDAGRVTFGDEIDARGHHPTLDMDLADVYCP